MRHINHNSFKLVVVFLLSTWLLACGSTLTEAEYLSNAKESLEKADTKTAVINIKNALKLNAANQEAHAMLGHIMLDSDSPALAEVEFEKLKQLGADKNIWLTGLSKALLLQGKLSILLQMDESVDSNEEKVKLLAYKVMALVQQKKIDQAKAYIQQAEALGVESLDLYIAKIRYYANSKKFDKARSITKKVLSKNAFQYDALLLLGDIELHDKLFDKAEAAYLKAHEGSPERSLALVQLAKVQLANKHYAEAQNALNTLLKRYPEHLEVNLLQGKLYVEQGKKIKALPFIEKAANTDYSPLDAYYYAAMIHLEDGHLEQADQYARQLIAKVPRSVLATLLRANVRLQQKQFTEAESLTKQVLQAQPENTAALNILATALMQQGKVDQALPYFEKVARLQPDNLSSALRLADALLRAKQFVKADEAIQQVLAAEKNSTQAISLKIRSAISQGNKKEAHTLIAGLKKQLPTRAAPYILESLLYKKDGSTQKELTALEQGCRVEPESLESCLGYAELLRDEKQFEKALAVYDSVITHHKGRLNVALGKAKLFAMQKKYTEMVDWLTTVSSQFPSAIQPKLILGQYYLSEGKGEKALSLFGTTDKEVLRNPRYLQLLASAQLETKQFKKARLTVQRLLKAQPNNKEVLMLNALVKSSLGNSDKAERDLKEMLRGDPKNIALMVSVAKVLYQQKKYEEAETFLAGLDKEQSEKVGVLQLRSSLALSLGKYQQAMKLAQKAFDQQPVSANLLLLAQQTWRGGYHDDALTLMTDWLNKNPDDLDVRFELANLYMQEKKTDLAIQENEVILQQDANNIFALNNLAWEYRETKPAKALELAAKLNDIKPGVPAFLDTLAIVQLKNGYADLASRYIDQAISKQRAPAFVYHKAMIDAEKGDWLKAIKSLSVLLEKGERFAEREEAKLFLKKLKAGE